MKIKFKEPMDEETKAVFESAKRTAAEVAKWPAWKRGVDPKTEAEWTIEDAVENFFPVIQRELAKAGWHSALGGSVLHKGYSKKDLDVIVFPNSSVAFNIEKLWAALQSAGMHQTMDADRTKREWRRLGSIDQKHVEIWDYGGKRVDVFVLS